MVQQATSDATQPAEEKDRVKIKETMDNQPFTSGLHTVDKDASWIQEAYSSSVKENGNPMKVNSLVSCDRLISYHQLATPTNHGINASSGIFHDRPHDRQFSGSEGERITQSVHRTGAFRGGHSNEDQDIRSFLLCHHRRTYL